MDLYSRFLLQVLYALQHAFARIETFAFSTRLVRITESLSRDTYREALDALAAVPDGGWSGGTKIGESLEAMRLGWPRLFDRRTAVIVLSDGWDTGDPEVLKSILSTEEGPREPVVEGDEPAPDDEDRVSFASEPKAVRTGRAYGRFSGTASRSSAECGSSGRSCATRPL